MDRRTTQAIAVGGVLGAGLRWAITRFNEPEVAGWFAYEPNNSVVASPSGRAVRSAEALSMASGVPLDTLAANVAGCLLLGITTYLLARATSSRRRVLVGVATGFCGSLTTFATFATELAVILRGSPATRRFDVEGPNLQFSADRPSALLYLLTSVALGGVAFWAGRRLAHLLGPNPEQVRS